MSYWGGARNSVTSLGVNEAAPGVAGLVTQTLSSNGVTGWRAKRATDTSPTGNFIDFQSAAGATIFSVSIAGAVTASGYAITTGTAFGITSDTRLTFTAANGAVNALLLSAASNTQTSGTSSSYKIATTFAPTSTSTMVAIEAYLNPTINYSAGTPGAGSYEALRIDVVETALPTGTNYLIRARTGAAGTTDVFSVLRTGVVQATGVVLATTNTVGIASDTLLTFTAANGAVNALALTAASNTQTSGTASSYKVATTFAPTATSTLVAISAYLNPTINYSNGTPGAGSYEVLRMDVVETALPTGTSYFIRARNGAAGTTDVFSVTRAGVVTGTGLVLATTNTVGIASNTLLTFTAANGAVNALALTVASNTQTSGTAATWKVSATFAPTSTSTMVSIGSYINPTINYSAGTPGAGSYEALRIDVVETALPTGTNYLIRARTGAAGTTDVFSVSRAGVVTATGVVLATTNTVGITSDTLLTFTAANAAADALAVTVASNTQTSGTARTFRVTSSFAPTSTSTMVAVGLFVNPTINYSNGTPGAGSYAAIQVDAVETALPTGTNYLLRLRAGAAGTTDKFTITNGGAASGDSATLTTSVTTPLLQTAAGTNLAITPVAPAQAASTTTGVTVTITASAAVAGSSNAGAAAGGAVTVTTGAAARLTSGNANGGNFVVNLGAGIGTGTSGYANFTQNTGTPVALPSSLNLAAVFVGQDSTNPCFVVDAAGNNASIGFPLFQFRRARGTIASPTAVQNNDILGQIGQLAATGAGTYNSSAAVLIDFLANETWTSTANGARGELYATANTTTTLTKIFTWYQGIQIGSPTGGDKGAGTVNPSGAYYSNGTLGVGTVGTGTAVTLPLTAFTTAGGIVTVATGTSDERLKDVDTAWAGYGLRELRGIRPIRYRWNDVARAYHGEGLARGLHYGFAAQNVRACMPDAVGLEEWRDGQAWLTVNDRVILGAAVCSIQEIDTEIARLRARIEVLEEARNN